MTPISIKICGITRIEDAQLAANLGAHALGMVFYPQSPRCVNVEQANKIVHAVSAVSPFVTTVGLFVNAEIQAVQKVLNAVPLHMLQFHGDEDEAYCRSFNRPYIKAARVTPQLDLVEYAHSFPSAQALLLDAYVDAQVYGGGGKTFDWTQLPPSLPLPLILAGGLNTDNVGVAIRTLRTLRLCAVDVSSGVETAKGIKDAKKMAAFIAKIKNANQTIE